eukprot:2744452-Amphidinium_carterae.1
MRTRYEDMIADCCYCMGPRICLFRLVMPNACTMLPSMLIGSWLKFLVQATTTCALNSAIGRGLQLLCALERKAGAEKCCHARVGKSADPNAGSSSQVAGEIEICQVAL